MVITLSCGSSVDPNWLKNAISSAFRVKTFSPNTEYLIASRVQDNLYRKAVSLGVPILSPSFIDECSKRQLIYEEDVHRLAQRHHLPRFTGIRVYLCGESDGVMEAAIQRNGGIISYSPSTATHLVVPCGVEPPSSTSTQHVVSTSWFRESMDLGWCANEKSFNLVKRRQLRRKSARRTIMRQISNRIRDDSGLMKYKRYQICRELFLTEINCLKAIDFLLRISVENNHLSSTQNDVIFGSFAAMKEVHSEIVEKLGKVLEKWDDNSMIGHIFVEVAGVMERAYISYFQGLEAAVETLKYCKKKNTRFRTYVEMKERDRNIDKQKLEYLLNVPYQQLTSRVSVTLKEILDKTDENTPDHTCITAGIEAVTQVLRKCNECKKKSVESEAVYKQVKDVPARMICTSRKFLEKLEFVCLCSPDQNWGRNGLLVELLLFEDALMITRKLLRAVSCISITGHSSGSKRYKFVDVYPMACVRDILILRRTEDVPVVIMTLRNETGDAPWFLQMNTNMDLTMKFIKTIQTQVYNVSGRELSVSTSQSSVNAIQYRTELGEIERNQSSFARSLSSTSAFGKLRSYSQRLRIRKTYSDYGRAKRGKGMDYLNAKGVFENKNEYDEEKPEQTMKPETDFNSDATSCLKNDDVMTPTEERVNPYEGIKYFSPLRNIQSHRNRSILDDCC